MISRLETYERRLAAAHRIERLKKYLSLTGIGFALWLNDLWNMALENLKIVDKQLNNWFIRLFIDAPPKLHPVLDFVDSVMFLLFLVFSTWLIYWAYMDTYVRRAHGEKTWSFPKKFIFGVVVNAVIYSALSTAMLYALPS